MLKRMITLFITGLLVLTCQGSEPQLAKSKIDSIGLFKNGLAYIKRSIKFDKPGQYIITDVPEPVYGTFWVESNATVSTRVTMKELEEDITASSSLEACFVNKNVTIYLKGDKQNSPIKGELISTPDKSTKNWNRNYNSTNYYQSYIQPNQPSQPTVDRYIKIKTAEGITFLDRNMIASITAESSNAKQKIKKPVLILDVQSVPQEPATIQINYLSKGFAWAASYVVDISSEKQLSITQKAVIKNELMDIDNVPLQLISGFPNVKFAHVNSPLSLNTSWSNFFQQLSQRTSDNHAVMRNVMTQQAVSFNNRTGTSPQLPSSLSDGVDIYYNNVGSKTMQAGDSLALNVAQKQTDYEKIVLWDIPDTRNANGRYIQDYERNNNPEKYQNNIWDSIRFKNPFEFPMTTAAATFIKDGNFIGESISYWVNPSEETVLPTNKALSLSTKSTEKEIPEKRKRILIFGDNYQKCEVEGKLVLKNYRKTAVKIMIKRRFSGELLSADDKPKCELREEGVYSVNNRNELTWEFTLDAGAEKEINYKYEVLVNI